MSHVLINSSVTEDGETIPEASEQYRGMILIEQVNNVDTAYICLQTGEDTYAWKTFSLL